MIIKYWNIGAKSSAPPSSSFPELNFSVLFIVLYGSLPWQLLLLNIIFEFINISVLLLFVPKMLISLELRKARMMRKIINDNFWDTEKIKEQSFKGVNDIK